VNRSNAVDFIKRQPVTGRGMANTDSKFMGALSTFRRRDGGAIVIVAEKPSPGISLSRHGSSASCCSLSGQ
jgi:hypothetical protein